MVYCFKRKSKEDKYLLQWDEGDSLVCDGAICEGVKGLSDMNRKVFRLKGAHTTEAGNTAKVEENNYPLLSPQEIVNIEQELEKIKQEKAIWLQNVMDCEQKQRILENKLSVHYHSLSEVLRLSKEKD